MDVDIENEDNDGHQTLLWICTEQLTDTFKFLNRSDLVRGVQPAIARFNAICENKVKSIHVIKKFGAFINDLARNLPEANQQYADLSGNDCDLSKHFRLSGTVEFRVTKREQHQTPAYYKRLRRYQMCVLRHSLELFNGCRLFITLPDTKSAATPDECGEFLAYLRILQPIRLTAIALTAVNTQTVPPMEELFREPTILNCARLTLSQPAKRGPGVQEIVDWLHHCPVDETERGKTRCLTVSNNSITHSVEELVDKCTQRLLKAETARDRRPFVLSFGSQSPFNDEGELILEENARSGEALLLENVDATRLLHRLVRCPRAEIPKLRQFYQRAFCDFGKFRLENGCGEEPPILAIS